ncbi:hypothetical protein [Sorangium sp. So ce1182]|uniref:hypothetical protein n=1 Tax=Sorangium sp. So ce1182 TaxID=3133334 RepID=UPI003F62B6AC
MTAGGGALGFGGGTDTFVAQWDTTGTHAASARYVHGEQESGQSIAVDGSDNTVLMGVFNSGIGFGGTPLENQSDDTGDFDVFLAHLSS